MQRALPVIVFALVLISARIIGALNSESLGNLQPFGSLFFCGMTLTMISVSGLSCFFAAGDCASWESVIAGGG
ncbi:hypothetical protein OAG25_03850 [Akkermansiaceae bacterium]|nr:hypothetical protein [Akkermansiaceae bacterium]